jgi:type IV pilus assembly protein PilY1
LIDCNDDGFADKAYAGDLGGQMWRLGWFKDAGGNPLAFPDTDQNINNWTAQVLLNSDTTHGRKFFYPPSVTLEHGFDLVFMGTGDRYNACAATSSDRIYCVKDNHGATTLEEADLVDMTASTATAPNLLSETGDADGNGRVDQGWYVRLAAGEKQLAESVVFNKALYATTFTPNDDPCLPGGIGKLYAFEYKTADAVTDFGDDDGLKWSVELGGGIPSKPVTVITQRSEKFLISVGSTNPDQNSEEVTAGIVEVDPVSPGVNFFYLWWNDL